MQKEPRQRLKTDFDNAFAGKMLKVTFDVKPLGAEVFASLGAETFAASRSSSGFPRLP